jgi:hypothetical protein
MSGNGEITLLVLIFERYGSERWGNHFTGTPSSKLSKFTYIQNNFNWYQIMGLFEKHLTCHPHKGLNMIY